MATTPPVFSSTEVRTTIEPYNNKCVDCKEFHIYCNDKCSVCYLPKYCCDKMNIVELNNSFTCGDCGADLEKNYARWKKLICTHISSDYKNIFKNAGPMKFNIKFGIASDNYFNIILNSTKNKFPNEYIATFLGWRDITPVFITSEQANILINRIRVFKIIPMKYFIHICFRFCHLLLICGM
jgi:hypothetical protein